MIYQLWDTESSNLVMEFPTEAEALAEVRDRERLLDRLAPATGTKVPEAGPGDALNAHALLRGPSIREAAVRVLTATDGVESHPLPRIVQAAEVSGLRRRGQRSSGGFPDRVLHEGCHRAAALYLAGAERFDFLVWTSSPG